MTDLAMKTIEVDGVTKYTINFALTDETGAPIMDRSGRPRITNLVADSVEQLVEKMATANIEASRAADRANKMVDTLKSKRPTPRPEPVKIEGKPLTQEEKVQIGLDAQDPRKAADAIQRVVEAAVPVKAIATEIGGQREREEYEAGKRAGEEFANLHKRDYYPCQANANILGGYLLREKLACTVDNLEIAFAAEYQKLVPVPAAPNEAPADGNAPPRNDANNSGAPSSQKRRAPVGGISNDVAGARPGPTDVMTRKQAMDLLYKEPMKFESMMRDPVQNEILNRALAGR